VVLADANVIIYAHREDTEHHSPCRRWLEATINGDECYGVSELVLSGFVRVVTHPKVFASPSSLKQALEFAEQVREQPNAMLIEPGERHWSVFRRQCVEARAKRNLIPDAYFAAVAIEGGCEWTTTDRDYSRFPGLR
jgi:hypothetical protein